MKSPNPALKKLGFSNTDRLVIIHTDDIGMCQASLQAYQDLWEAGAISSGAVMVPCAWFPATAAYCRAHPEVDMGVHATLNCEWEGYRWGPVSTCDPASGLLDADGYMHMGHQAVYTQADPGAVGREVNAQVERALNAGIDATHLDSHMGTITHPRFVQSYIEAALSHRIPPMVPRLDLAGLVALGMDADAAALQVKAIQQMEEVGLPMVDRIIGMSLSQHEDQAGQFRQHCDNFPAGITHFIFHPSVDTPELRAITPDWQARVANYQFFLSPEARRILHDSGVQVIGYRALRTLLRG